MEGANQNNSTEEECIRDADCQASNIRAACSVDGVCFVPETVSGLLIQDVTPADTIPADGQPGADIAAVYLIDADDRIVAYGDTLSARNPIGERVLSPIVGDRPNLNAAESCVDGELPDAAASLGGEGGFILLQFIDLEGAIVSTSPDTWRVVVIEWSDNCDASITDDQEAVTVQGCIGPSFDALEFDADCDVSFGTPFAGRAVLTADDT